MSQQLHVSLIIPTHNRALLVVQTVQAALRQTLAFDEIIVVDDASTDDTLLQLQPFTARIRVIASEKIGVQAARNLGVAAAHSPYITFCDSDDLLQPDFLQHISSWLVTHPEIDSVYSNYCSFQDGQTQADILSGAPAGFFDGALSDGDFVTDIPDLYKKTVTFQPMMPTGVTVKKCFYERIGGFNPAFDRVPSEDWEYTLRAIASGKTALCRRPLVRIRRHSGNDSRDLLRVMLGEVAVMQFALEHHASAQPYRQAFIQAIRKRHNEVFYKSFRTGQLRIAGAVFPFLEDQPATCRFRFKMLLMRLFTSFRKCELHSILQLPVPAGDASGSLSSARNTAATAKHYVQ